MVRKFELPFGRGLIVFSESSLCHMYQHAQTKWCSKEAGGQLFSFSPDKDFIQIIKATGPYKNDKRSRSHFNPSVSRINNDRDNLYNKGLHPVGLWHTHPESIPKPSDSDRNTTFEYLKAFKGDMDGFLLVILGNAGKPLNMSVWVAMENPEKNWIKLEETTQVLTVM